jgi:hypothetical protein
MYLQNYVRTGERGALNDAMNLMGVRLGEPDKPEGPSRTQTIKAQFNKNDPELRRRVQQSVVQRLGEFPQWAFARSGGVVTPDQIMQANAAGESAVYQEYEKEYTETINKVIDKTIDLMQAQALGGEATQVDPALEARNAALDKAIAEAIEELRELQKM